MKEKLKPCPFCGNKDLLIAVDDEVGSTKIICQRCMGMVDNLGTEDETIKAWNRRAEKSNRYNKGYLDGYVKAQKEFAERLKELRAACLDSQTENTEDKENQ